MRYLILAAFAAVHLATAYPATAADAPTPMSPVVIQSTAGDWTVAISPYLWAASISGHVSAFGLPPIQLSADFSDILQNLNFAAMVIGEARNGRFSVFGDAMYTRLEVDTGSLQNVPEASVSLSSTTFAGLLGAGYSVLQVGGSHLDVVAAARLWHVGTDISIDSSGPFDGTDVSDDATWVDGLAGLRARYDFNESVYFTGWGIVGAGGSDIDWDVAGGLAYQFGGRWSAVAGYRALGVDYSRDGFLLDIVQQGPILGVIGRF
jgi:hypothetical protein